MEALSWSPNLLNLEQWFPSMVPVAAAAVSPGDFNKSPPGDSDP